MKDYVSIHEILGMNWSERFYFQRTPHGFTFGNKLSHMRNDDNAADITFDISNNKVLANMDVNGAIKNLTIFRDTYRANEKPEGWAGVWLHKDFAEFGPYQFGITANGQAWNPADFESKSGFIDNIIPITEAQGMGLSVSYIACTPISADGLERPRGTVYAVHIQNISIDELAVNVALPQLFQDKARLDAPKIWCSYRGDDFELSLLDGGTDCFEVRKTLQAGQSLYVPVAIYAPGDGFVKQVNEKGSVHWMIETLQYYRGMLGRLEVEDDAIYGEFLERNILSSFQAVSMDKDDRISGSNWGTNTSHFAIWIKDMYYSILPVGMFDVNLFRKAILWFAEYGVRHPGHLLAGGVSHSLSVSLTALIYSGIYYGNTGDKTFFLENRNMRAFFESLVITMLADRVDAAKYLFTTRYLSDGETYADWHTGTNICAFQALKSLALLMKDIYGDMEKSSYYDDLANRTRQDIETHCMIETNHRIHYNEGVFIDQTRTRPLSDGEESDTTLMPYYGFCRNDDACYASTMAFAMSEDNLGYCAASRCVKWVSQPNKNFDGVPATMPGYMKGLGAISSNEAFHDSEGFLWNLLRMADADGGLWWWPYGYGKDFEIDKPKRGYAWANGKASWGAGVFSVLFIERFLGVSYDALTKTLALQPTALKSYKWDRFKIGNSRFSITYQSGNGHESFLVSNHNDHGINVKLKSGIHEIGPRQEGRFKSLKHVFRI
jgi:hypothetical protein